MLTWIGCGINHQQYEPTSVIWTEALPDRHLMRLFCLRRRTAESVEAKWNEYSTEGAAGAEAAEAAEKTWKGQTAAIF